jgi:exopolysaccharide production protein ExoQ
MTATSASPTSTAADDVGLPRATQHWVRLFCSSAFLFFMGAATHLFGGDEDTRSGGSLGFLYAPAALAIQIVAIGLLAAPSRQQKTIELLRQNRMLLFALFVILASTLWSIDPGISLRRGLALLGTTAVGVLIYVEIGRRDVLRFFAVNLALFMVGGVLLALAFPEFGTHVHDRFEGDWRGLVGFKNQAAWIAVIFMLVWLRTKKVGWMRTWNYPLILMSLAFLYLTGSATGLAAFAFGVAVLCALSIYTRSPLFRPLLLAGVGSISLLTAMNFQALFAWTLETLQRDQSLTGRTSLWTALWPFIEERFWLGSGYRAFWDNASDYFGADNWMTGIGHAHNAYFEVLLDVGVIGLAAQLAFLLICCWRLFSAATRGDRDAAAMLAIFLTLAVIGIAGSLFFRANTGIWVITVAFACYSTECRPQFIRGGLRKAQSQ